MNYVRTLAALTLAVHPFAMVQAQNGPRPSGSQTAIQLPEGQGRDVTQKVCGMTCHGAEIIMGEGRSRDQWTAVVNAMVARGARATENELGQIANYLSTHFGTNYVAPASLQKKPAVAKLGVGPTSGTGRGPGPLGAGAADSHVVDNAGAERGKAIYMTECMVCHGPRARGGNKDLPANQQGPNLVRSLIVLRDRYGSQIGPFLLKGHTLKSGRQSASLKTEELIDLSHFLHQTVYNTLRTGNELRIQNILTGDKKAGEEFFNGAGRCKNCHSATGDLAAYGKRFEPPSIQQKFLFPRTVAFSRDGSRGRSAKPVTVTVTLADEKTVEGVLERLDDFNVSLRDAQGDYRSFVITPSVKVVKHDPLDEHVKLLDEYTDKNIHDITAYLESLK